MANANIADLIVVRVDGGICSQMAFCSLGLSLQKRGYRVKYDLSFYKDNGKDEDGRFPRNWDMPKAFPALRFEEATEAERAALKGRFSRRSELLSSWRPPLYVGGYPDCSGPFLEILPLLRANFKPEIPPGMDCRLVELDASPACAVHVRRGDLARANTAYGAPTTVEYYRRAMTVVASFCPGVRFCFFSDEPSWVRERVLPLVPPGCAGTVMEANGSDCGYLDLYMIARCPYVISSIGSLGVYGAMLSSKNPLLVLSRFSVLAMKGAPNAVYLVAGGSASPVAFRADAVSCAIPEAKLRGFWYYVYRLWRKLGLWLSDGAVRIEMFPAR